MPNALCGIREMHCFRLSLDSAIVDADLRIL